MFHKVIINRKMNFDIENDEEILIQVTGNVAIHPIKTTTRNFCSVQTGNYEFKVLGTLDELMDKFNNKKSSFVNYKQNIKPECQKYDRPGHTCYGDDKYINECKICDCLLTVESKD